MRTPAFGFRRLVLVLTILALPACGQESNSPTQPEPPRQSSEVVGQVSVQGEASASVGTSEVVPGALATLWVRLTSGAPVNSVEVSGGGIAWELIADASAGPQRRLLLFAGTGNGPTGSVSVTWGVTTNASAVVTLIQHVGRVEVSQGIAANWQDAGGGRATSAELPRADALAEGDLFVAAVLAGDGGLPLTSTSGCSQLAPMVTPSFTGRIDECPADEASWSWGGALVHWMAVGAVIR